MGDHDRRAVDDVRMRGFAHRHTVEAALAWLDAQLRPPGDEIVPLRMAAGRVLATAVVERRRRAWIRPRHDGRLRRHG